LVLSAGTRLGNYEIQEAVGAGGMGEVYRARDTRLNRDVALKVLPQAFVLDADRLARFKREAQLLASLNHTNIAAIYGFEEANGFQALVLEFIDGPTLAGRIASGPIPVDEALPVALQIANALEAAHEQGIIHRDLKPANVKVRDDGTVKVLDFGLAKMVGEGPPNGGHDGDRSIRHQPDFSASPTITTPAMTMAGVLLGTATYMSPEQAKGRPADKRSDIWAFGCVLFEMLTGRKAFDGEDVTDTIAAIVRAEPPWSALPDDVPASIQLFLRRCLEKDRKKRIGDIAVAQFLLSEDPRLAGSPAEGVHQVRPRLYVWSLVVTAIITTLVIAGIGWTLRPRPVPPPIVRFSHTLAAEDRLTGIQRHQVAISPDGTQIVYVANGRLYRRPVGDLQSRVIPGTEDILSVMGPVFSPDGQWIAYHATSASEEAIKRIPLSGGSPTTILRTANPFGMSWDDSGILYSAGRDGIFRISANGGTPEQLIRLGEDEAAWAPHLLPGGKAVLFTLISAPQGIPFPQWDNARIVVQSLASGERKSVVDGASDARYLPSGHLVFAVSGSLFAVAFDPGTATVISDRVPILAGIRRGNAIGAAQFSVSTNGSLAYMPGPVNATFTRRSLILFDRSGTITRLKLPPAPYEHPRVSPDGKRLAVVTDDDENAEISIYEMAETSALRRLTIGGHHNSFPVWSSNGERVAFQSDREGDRGLFWQRADGLGTAERLTTAAEDAAHIPESFSRDGKHLLFTELKSGTYSLRVLSIDDKSSVPFGNVTSAEPTGAVFSPDGRWVAYASTTRAGGLYSPNRGVFIQPFPATGVPFQVPKGRIDYHPAWSPDGKSLFFIASAPQPLVVVNVNTQPSVTFGIPAELPRTIPRPSRFSGSTRGYDILPDGRILSLVPIDEDSTGGTIQSEIRVVVNWIEELKRMVPR